MYRTHQMWDDPTSSVVIRAIGIGGAGVNTLNHLIEAGVSGMDFIAMNTDHQNLRESFALNRVSLGPDITNGMGSGGDPIRGKAAAEASEAEIAKALEGAQLVFITAGLGGGTGTGAAPVVARIAKAQGALTIGIVTLPFEFEGTYRQNLANNGLAILQKEIDTLVVIANDKLKERVPQNARIQDAFRPGTEILRRSIESMSYIIHTHGEMNLDFADLCAIAKDAGRATLVVGSGTGEDRVKKALADVDANITANTLLANASRMMVNITARSTVSFTDAHVIMEHVKLLASHEVNLHTGLIIDDDATNELIVTVLATGFADVVSNSVEQFQKRAIYGNTAQESSSAINLLESLRHGHVVQPVPSAGPTHVDAVPSFIQSRKAQQVVNVAEVEVEVEKTAVNTQPIATPVSKPTTKRVNILTDTKSIPDFLSNR